MNPNSRKNSTIAPPQSVQAQCQTLPARVWFSGSSPSPTAKQKKGEGAEAPSPQGPSVSLCRSRHGEIPERCVQTHVLPDGGDPTRPRQSSARRAPDETATEYPLL